LRGSDRAVPVPGTGQDDQRVGRRGVVDAKQPCEADEQRMVRQHAYRNSHQAPQADPATTTPTAALGGVFVRLACNVRLAQGRPPPATHDLRGRQEAHEDLWAMSAEATRPES